jgi:kinesin family protein C2/C3
MREEGGHEGEADAGRIDVDVRNGNDHDGSGADDDSHEPVVLDPDWQPVFETYVGEDGEELTTLVLQSGDRLYADFASNDWKPFPKEWEGRGHFKGSEYTKEHLRRAEEQDYSAEQVGELLGQIKKMGEAQRAKDRLHAREMEELHLRITALEAERVEADLSRAKEVEAFKAELLKARAAKAEEAERASTTQHGQLQEVIAAREHAQGELAELREANAALSAKLERMARENEGVVTSLEGRIAEMLSRQAAESDSGKKSEDDLSVKLFHAERERDTVQAKLKELEAELADARERAAAERAALEQDKQALRAELAEVQARTASRSGMVSKLSYGLQAASASLAQLNATNKALKAMVKSYHTAMVSAASTAVNKFCTDMEDRVAASEAAVGTLKDKYHREMALRKQLFNRVQELQGNIRVYARCRDLIPSEPRASTELAVKFEEEDEVTVVDRMDIGRKHEFSRVFGMSSTQEEVFDGVRDLVTSCVDGYRVCIFAYGQTGAGKTFTMMGTPENRGVNVRAINELFAVARERDDDWDTSVKVSMIEIYNEKIRDLLDAEGQAQLDIRQGPDGPHVPGLVEVAVKDADDVLRVLSRGEAARTTHATSMNAQSSRSHSMLLVSVQSANKTTGSARVGHLTLVDLAGSERLDKTGAQGQRLLEAQNINKSLSALGNVITGLKSNNSHVPYRDSKLTHLLQPSLSGDAKVLLFVNISPKKSDAEESLNSLRFGIRCQNTELGNEKAKPIPKVLKPAAAAPAGAKPSSSATSAEGKGKKGGADLPSLGGRK